MELIYPFFITFSLIFFSELGDKTQLLVLSFSSKSSTLKILLGVALGTFFSHGIAILFGSSLGCFENESFTFALKIFTYISFILFGILGFLIKDSSEDNKKNHKSNILNKITSLPMNYVLIVAISIIIGEIGDKTFLASLGLGLQYPHFKLSLILGAICGMVASNSLAIIFGKLLSTKISDKYISLFSNILFIIFGVVGLIMILH